VGLAALGLAGCPSQPPEGPDPTLVADPASDDGGMPGAGLADFDRGVEFIKRQAYAEAVTHFDKVLEADPRHAQAEYYRALAREQLGERDGAIAGYEKALALDEGLVDAAINLGAMYLVEDPEHGVVPQPDKAIAVLKKAAAKVDDDPGVYENLGFAYRLAKSFDQATKEYLKAIKLADEGRTRFALGDMLVEAKRCEEAAKHLGKAAKAMGDDFPTLVTIADLLGQCRAFAPCVETLDAAIKLKPSEPQWYVRRGLCRHGLKDEKNARADFQLALKKDPKFAAAHYYLGQSWRAEKKSFNARKAFEEAAKLDPNGPIGKKAKQALKAMK
jgi:tetratricopeptide (TPR) repeat protein